MPARSTSISASSAPVPEHNATSQVGYHCSSSRWTSLARVLRQRKAEIKEGQRNVLVQITLSFSAQPFRVHHARMAAWRKRVGFRAFPTIGADTRKTARIALRFVPGTCISLPNNTYVQEKKRGSLDVDFEHFCIFSLLFSKVSSMNCSLKKP